MKEKEKQRGKFMVRYIFGEANQFRTFDTLRVSTNVSNYEFNKKTLTEIINLGIVPEGTSYYTTSDGLFFLAKNNNGNELDNLYEEIDSVLLMISLRDQQ